MIFRKDKEFTLNTLRIGGKFFGSTYWELPDKYLYDLLGIKKCHDDSIIPSPLTKDLITYDTVFNLGFYMEAFHKENRIVNNSENMRKYESEMKYSINKYLKQRIKGIFKRKHNKSIYNNLCLLNGVHSLNFNHLTLIHVIFPESSEFSFINSIGDVITLKSTVEKGKGWEELVGTYIRKIEMKKGTTDEKETEFKDITNEVEPLIDSLNKIGKLYFTDCATEFTLVEDMYYSRRKNYYYEKGVNTIFLGECIQGKDFIKQLDKLSLEV